MQLQTIISTQTNPFVNVAVENYLLAQPNTDLLTLYLWKNHRTVVIGQNQNPYTECNVELLEREGGYLMRRSTGGGAVYHDDGNINFSFVIPHAHYDVPRQLNVIGRALAAYGLSAEVSGRNDLLCDGRKFSGNAFSKARFQNLHHGTILIKGNVADMQRYLRVNPAKLHKHGVSSVHSRVVNLSELAEVTSTNIVPHLIEAFQQVYGQKTTLVDFDQLAACDEVVRLTQQFASDEWRFTKWRSFCATRSGNSDWGLVELSLTVDQMRNVIEEAVVASDSLDVAAVNEATSLLRGASTLSQPDCSHCSPIAADIVKLAYSEA